MRTLITGGTGVIGAEVARLLIGRGTTEITLFDVNDSLRRLDDIEGTVTFVRSDVGIFSHVLDVVRSSRAEMISHLGAMPWILLPPGKIHEFLCKFSWPFADHLIETVGQRL
jgi:nucleoside-diphosphate-sugar epimerase